MRCEVRETNAVLQALRPRTKGGEVMVDYCKRMQREKARKRRADAARRREVLALADAQYARLDTKESCAVVGGVKVYRRGHVPIGFASAWRAAQ